MIASISACGLFVLDFLLVGMCSALRPTGMLFRGILPSSYRQFRRTRQVYDIRSPCWEVKCGRCLCLINISTISHGGGAHHSLFFMPLKNKLPCNIYSLHWIMLHKVPHSLKLWMWTGTTCQSIFGRLLETNFNCLLHNIMTALTCFASSFCFTLFMKKYQGITGRIWLD